MFQAYRDAYDALQSDPTVLAIRQQIEELEERLFEVESPYKSRMAKAEEEIRTTVLAEGHSVTLHGVKATYYSGRRSTSWKSVAEEFSPPDELVAKYTTVGEPSVKVEIV